jgi:acetolactate synthase-1/2/3 large subunit
MAKRRNSPDVARRSFLEGASLVGAAALTPVPAKAQIAAPRPNLKAAVPGPKLVAADTMRPAKDPVTQTSSGGDFMVDVLLPSRHSASMAPSCPASNMSTS